jgi:hypothetical protein
LYSWAFSHYIADLHYKSILLYFHYNFIKRIVPFISTSLYVYIYLTEFTIIMQPEEFRDEIRNMIRDEIQSFCRKNPDQFTRRLNNPDTIKNHGDYNVFSLL